MKGALVPVQLYPSLPTRADMYLSARSDSGRQGNKGLQRAGGGESGIARRVVNDPGWGRGPTIKGGLIDVYA